MKTQPHPIQPLYKDTDGRIKFKANQIVRDLLHLASQHGMDLNNIACRAYSDQDRQQLAQLIGYSLDGYGELRSYVDDAAYAVAEAKSRSKRSDVELERDHYRRELVALRRALRKPMARLFEKHPEDLTTQA